MMLARCLQRYVHLVMPSAIATKLCTPEDTLTLMSSLPSSRCSIDAVSQADGALRCMPRARAGGGRPPARGDAAVNGRN
jgi:hypothetical protein